MSSELDRVRRVWERLGTSEPYWAVITASDSRDSDAREEFFGTGRGEVREFLDLLEKHGAQFSDHAVDFGCGVGRLTYPLAEHYKHVTGVDVAASMIEEATASNPFPDRVSFVHNDAATLPFEDNSVDLIVSLITMQHIPPALSMRYMLEMARVTRPGGHIMFQLPSVVTAVRPIPPSYCRAWLKVVEVPSTMTALETAFARVEVTNMGDGEWPPKQFLNAGNHWYRDGVMVQQDDGRDRIKCPVPPGGTTEALVQIVAPATPGTYELEIDLVQEGVFWWTQLGSKTVRVPIEVQPAEDPEVAEVGDELPHHTPGWRPAEKAPVMEMHGIRKELVCGMFEQIGCTVLEAIPDERAGSDWNSYFYVIEVGEYRIDFNYDE